jgi:hypothetical protein
MSLRVHLAASCLDSSVGVMLTQSIQSVYGGSCRRRLKTDPLSPERPGTRCTTLICPPHSVLPTQRPAASGVAVGALVFDSEEIVHTEGDLRGDRVTLTLGRD